VIATDHDTSEPHVTRVEGSLQRHAAVLRKGRRQDFIRPLPQRTRRHGVCEE
jgi:hypothetical protein